MNAQEILNSKMTSSEKFKALLVLPNYDLTFVVMIMQRDVIKAENNGIMKWTFKDQSTVTY